MEKHLKQSIDNTVSIIDAALNMPPSDPKHIDALRNALLTARWSLNEMKK